MLRAASTSLPAFSKIFQIDDVKVLPACRGLNTYGRNSMKKNPNGPSVTSLDKALYSIPEVCKILSLSKATVYKLIEAGRLVAVKPTTHYRIPAKSIVTYVDKLEQDARYDRESRKDWQ